MRNTEREIPYENLEQLNRPFTEQYRSGFEAFLNSGWYVLGESVNRFEENFAKYCGSQHFTGLASGLDALHIALKAYDFQPGSEVIVPSNTYIATILAIINNGLKPVLVEPDIRTYNMDVSKIEDAITLRTVAIMPVHLYGKCCDMEAIMQIAHLRNLKVIEDAAQAHGAKFKGKMAGTFGDFGAFSFYPTKNLGALGDAGGLITNDGDLNAKVRMIRNYGSAKKYFNEVSGMNSRMDEIQAVFLDIKLKALDEINAHKRTLANLYFSKLSGGFILPVIEPEYFDVYHIFNIRSSKRDELREYLLAQGIKTEIHYPLPPHQQKALRGWIDGAFPISEEIHSTTLSLPISFCHTIGDIEYVIEVLNRFRS